MERSLEILQPKVKIAAVARETAESLPISQLDGDHLIALSDVFIRLEQHRPNPVDRHGVAYVRQIRAYRLASAGDHMAGSTLPFAEKELFPGHQVTRDLARSRFRIQRVHENGKCIQLPSRQIETRHARSCNAVANHIAQLLNGRRPHPAVPSKPGSLVCAA